MAEAHPPRGEPPRMSPEAFTRQWAQIRQHLRGWWDRLTEQDLEQIAGQQDQLVRVIQERYQYLRERAQAEIDQRLQAYQTTGNPMAEALIAAAGEAASRRTETAEQERSPAAGTSRLDQYTGTLVALVRRYPVASVLLGLGVGFLCARSVGRARPASGVSAVRVTEALVEPAVWPREEPVGPRRARLVEEGVVTQAWTRRAHGHGCHAPGCRADSP